MSQRAYFHGAEHMSSFMKHSSARYLRKMRLSIIPKAKRKILHKQKKDWTGFPGSVFLFSMRKILVSLHCRLSEKRTFTAFTVIRNKLFHICAGTFKTLCKAVYTVKFFRISLNKLAMDWYVVRKQLSAALHTGFVICHYTFTTFARNIRQSWDSICAA